MAARIVLLRGINLGPTKRIAMPALRQAFTEAGYADVRTYVQSGNVVLCSDADAGQLAGSCERLIKDSFGFDVPVIVRTGEELAEVVRLNPLGKLAVDPKRYQVSFLTGELHPDVVGKLTELKAPSEKFVAVGREVYAWHPDGVARSKLWAALAGTKLGVGATSRNWTTVTALLAMAQDR